MHLFRFICYRTRQFLISRILRIAEKHSPLCIKGPDSLYKTVDLLKKQRTSRLLLVTSPGFLRRGTLLPLLAQLKAERIFTAIFSEVQPDPEISCVEKGCLTYQNNQCEAILAIGGGSVIDCAKLIGARIARPDLSIPQMKGMLKIRRKLPAIFAVPTTAGTGSEVTAAAVITDTVNGTHYKYPITDLCLIPACAVLDARLTIGLSPEMTAATGMDALTHAIEAYTNCFASSYVRKMASEACRLIFHNLPLAYHNGSDIKARQNLLLASSYAGTAFTNNFVGYVHALAHAIGGMYGIPHGLANAVLLPIVLKAYGPAIDTPLSELAEDIGLSGNTDSEKASAFLRQLDTLENTLQLPSCFPLLKEEDFDEIISRAKKEANPAYPVPKIWNDAQFRQVLQKCMR